MSAIPNRDITGECEGECEDLVTIMEKEQQAKIDGLSMESSTAQTPAVEYANTRNNAPGELGGHA